VEVRPDAEASNPGALPAANDHPPVPTVNEQPALWKRSSAEVLALVTDADMDALVGRPLTKDRALAALAARAELAERMRRRWLAIETARAAGATWDQIDTALGYPPGRTRRQYHRVLSRQKKLGLVAVDRRDPGIPQGPPL
jgi:hypothetical protein